MTFLLCTIFLLSRIYFCYSSSLRDFYPSGENPNRELSFAEYMKRRGSNNPHIGDYVRYDVNREFVTSGSDIPMKYTHKRIGISETNQFVRGNSLSIQNPLGHVSFELTNETKVGQTCSMIGINNNCRFTTNAGFYDRDTYIPYGTLISGGNVLSDDYQYNVMFGITKGGEYIAGYPTKEDIEKLDFEILITGIVWLVRNGENFSGTSGRYESIPLSSHTDLSARTAIGHDKDGNLILFQVDGKTWKDGYSVYDFADKLIKYGLYNAVNLDGGGSVSFVDDGILANSVTDKCFDRNLGDHDYDMCERTLSSVLCFHNRNVPPEEDEGDQDGEVQIITKEVVKELIVTNGTCGEDGVLESKDVVYMVLIFLLIVLIIFSFTVNAGLMVVLKKIQDRNRRGEAIFQIIDSDDTGSESTLDEKYFDAKDGNNVIYDSSGI